MNWNALFRIKGIDQITHETTADHPEDNRLKKALGVWDLTALGIAAVLGAGVFSTIGNAASEGGPAVVFLFIFTAIACAFSAFCYAEFASSIPVAGSAYTYAYASLGELLAWIIGWDLLMEYAIGNIAMAISWSQYFTSMLASYGIQIPPYLTMDYLSASRGFSQIQASLAQGKTVVELANGQISPLILKGYYAWQSAPQCLGIHLVCDLPALFITILITAIVYIGIEESKKASNFLVLLKIFVVILVIIVGATYVQPQNWIPFAPNGTSGVLKSVSSVFFAYIGFDAISTTAEECKNPQRDLPRGMIYSLIICTILYALVALVLTGMMNYKKLAVGDPLAYVFGPQGANVHWITGIINISALIALSTVLLVFQVGQPRIWMAMSRDGLLPPIFGWIHPKYKTPWVSTIITGLVVAIPSLFMNLTEVTDLTSIGTLFAFVIVCGGILKLNPKRNDSRSKFKTPYISSKYIFPFLVLIGIILIGYTELTKISDLMHLNRTAANNGLAVFDIIKQEIPISIFSIGMIVLAYYCFKRNLSLIPVLGLATCSYLMTELGLTNWIRFGAWLFVGFFVYFFYGIKNSRLRQTF